MTTTNHDHFEWRYTFNGRVRHALRKSADHIAICGAAPSLFYDWYGTGSQEEYERVESLPDCARCTRLLRSSVPNVSS